MRFPPFLEKKYHFPVFYKIHTEYQRPKIEHITDAVQKTLQQQFENFSIQAGETVGIGVGSRGIRNIAEIIRATCIEIKRKNAKPFIIPAMGSHGGATGQGQIDVLKTLGITEKSCECPVISTMDVNQIGTVFSEVPVYYSKDALELDHVLCVNRIKPHTKFKAAVESGVLKMLCIGLGKHEGALSYHKWALKYGFFPLLKEIASEVMRKTNFRFGIGVVENAYDETMHIEAMAKQDLISREEELLNTAKQNMPKLPVSQADVLIVQEMGKNFSGAGMDPNITGRAADLMEDDFSSIFKATRLAVLNLSKESKGNGLGVGNADIITEKLYKTVDYETTLMNIMTGISLKKAAIPIRMPNDEKAIQACFTTIGPIPPEEIRAIIIKNTLDIAECWISQALHEEVQKQSSITIIDKTNLNFNDNGDLVLDC